MLTLPFPKSLPKWRRGGEGQREREPGQERPSPAPWGTGFEALLGFFCPLVATLGYNGLPGIAAWHAGAGVRSQYIHSDSNVLPGWWGSATLRNH